MTRNRTSTPTMSRRTASKSTKQPANLPTLSTGRSSTSRKKRRASADLAEEPAVDSLVARSSSNLRARTPSNRGGSSAAAARIADAGLPASSGSGQQRWNEWKVFLHEGVLRSTSSITPSTTARASLVQRILRAGAKVESVYSVGVTHVVTVAGEELDGASKILRGAVMRSGFLRSGSRRSKDLLLKAAQKRTDKNSSQFHPKWHPGEQDAGCPSLTVTKTTLTTTTTSMT